jgi:dipeptidyl aminopeptidase/acylaminoacyl peptidase
MHYSIISSLFIVLIFCKSMVFSQDKDLDLEEIMTGKEFIGFWPENHSWLPSGKITFKWNPDKEINSQNFIVENFKPLKMGYEEISEIPSWNIKKHISNKFYVYTKNGRLLKWKVGENNPEIIYETYDDIYAPQLVNDESVVYFVRNNTLCKIDLIHTFYKEVLNFTKSSKKNNKSTHEHFLENQQLELFQYHREKKSKNQNSKDYLKNVNSWKRKPLEVAHVEDIFISPDEKSAIYSVIEKQKIKATHVENYLNLDGWSKIKNARPKVGRPDRKESIYVYSFDKDTSFSVRVDNLSGIFKRPVFLKEYEKDSFKKTSDLPKLVTFHSPLFNRKGDKAIIEIRSLDNKDRWITELDLGSGILKEIDHQHDTAWIGGPGISGWNSAQGAMGWMDEDRSIWYQSEETGYSHLYKKSLNKLKKTTLTDGSFEVRDASLSNDGETFYLTLNKSNAGNRGFYHLKHKTKELVPILDSIGSYQVKISPDEKKLAFLYSSADRPWELYATLNQPNALITKITHSTTSSFDAYQWRKPPIINFKGEDGISLPARLYKPTKEKSNGAGIIFVHGAGYLQNAHNWWSSYFREYMFHNLLCDLGYTVLDIDYRASEGYGRDWRTAIYRHMGGCDLKDQLSGRDYLVNQLAIDSNKIGIYGGSYGGFITLMALLTEPGKFNCGAALRSVTDWAHYNHEYTSNILNTPLLDSLSFKKSSPIYFAENLEDNLLMLHGVMDDNVQFQDVVRLSQRFIELKKEDWELALFPVEPHGFKQPTSWYNEYKRILKLFIDNLL